MVSDLEVRLQEQGKEADEAIRSWESLVASLEKKV